MRLRARRAFLPFLHPRGTREGDPREKEIPRIALETAQREGRFEAEGWRVRKMAAISGPTS